MEIEIENLLSLSDKQLSKIFPGYTGIREAFEQLLIQGYKKLVLIKMKDNKKFTLK